MLRTPPEKRPKKRRPTTKPSAKRKKTAGPQRERLKPISLWPLSFEEAIDLLLKGGPKSS